MQQFYLAHVVEANSPAEALRRAQLWLRGATRGEIGKSYRRGPRLTASAHAAYQEIVLGGDAEERPYADPYYWSAFQFSGA
jgi:CHAT domain-containing protein